MTPPRRASWLFDAELKGGHVHVTVRVGPKDDGRARSGVLVVDEWQWDVLRDLIDAGVYCHDHGEGGFERDLDVEFAVEIVERGFGDA